MQSEEFNLPQAVSFLCCQRIRQDVMSKNYDLTGIFQGFHPPGYPFGAEFMTFCRLKFEGTGQFKIDTVLSNEAGEKVSDSDPRTMTFGESPLLDLLTGWRVVFPKPGTYVFKLYCNNLPVGEFKVFCR
jgi:hypothetical protein